MSKTKVLIAVCIGIGALLTLLGWLAHWWPALDIINNGLPVLAAGAALLLCLALITRDWRLAFAAALLAAINLGLILVALRGIAPDAAPGSDRFLRVVTFNLPGRSHTVRETAAFLTETDADVVVFQEMTSAQMREFSLALGGLYPHSIGERGIVILSKHPILADGRIDRPGYPPWISLMLRWARLDVNGTTVELAGVHLTRPYHAALQEEDILTLAQFVRRRTLPLVVAGDFNMTPWTLRLKGFTRETALHRYNTFYPTWPLRRGDIPLVPLVAIDNVFASSHFASIALRAGPGLGSDHRPIIADMAISRAALAAAK